MDIYSKYTNNLLYILHMSKKTAKMDFDRFTFRYIVNVYSTLIDYWLWFTYII